MSTVTTTITVKVSGKITAKIDDAIIAEWIDDRLNDGRNVFVTSASRGGGGGRVYGKHRASAPGEYPATDSGRLANSVDSEMTGPRSGALFSAVEYAGFLTSGTSKMAPRKMLADALHEALSQRPASDELAKAATFEGGT